MALGRSWAVNAHIAYFVGSCLFLCSTDAMNECPNLASSCLNSTLQSFGHATSIIRQLLLSSFLSVCIEKSQSNLHFSLSSTFSGECSYHLSLRSNSYWPHKSQCKALATSSCLRLYSFCGNFGHSPNRWLTVSSFCRHIRHKESFCDLSILALTALVHNDWVCAAINRPSVSFFKYPCWSHVQDWLITCHTVCLSKELPMKFFSAYFLCSLVAVILFLNSVVRCNPSHSSPLAATSSFSLLLTQKLNRPNLASSTQSSMEHKPGYTVSWVQSIVDGQIFSGLSIKLF